MPNTSIAAIEPEEALGLISKREVSFSLKPVCFEVSFKELRFFSSIMTSAVRPTPDVLNKRVSLSCMERLVSSGFTVN